MALIANMAVAEMICDLTGDIWGISFLRLDQTRTRTILSIPIHEDERFYY